MSSKRSKKAYASLIPSLVIPNHFNCNQETRMVALYDEPVGSEQDTITMSFPGDIVGTLPRQVTAKRIGTQSIIFCTPVYSTSRGQVEVSPVLTQKNGEKIELGKFRLTLKHPLTTVMELCMKLSSSGAVLPVLTTLMLSVDKDGDKTHFMDSHTDRMMTLLVGSMKPGTSGTIRDILIPDKKWAKKNLTDLARMFGLRNMEKEAYMVTSRRQGGIKRAETMSIKPEEPVELESNPLSDSDETEKAEGGGMTGSFSSPSINTLEDAEIVQMTKQHMNSSERVYTVFQNFHSRDPGTLSLKAGQKVYVVTQNTSEPGWWYGALEGRHGLFPAWCVESPYKKIQAKDLPLPTPPKEPLPSVFVDASKSPPATHYPHVSLSHVPQLQEYKEEPTRTRIKECKKSDSVNFLLGPPSLGQSELSGSGDYVDMHLASNLSSDSENSEPCGASTISSTRSPRKMATISDKQSTAIDDKLDIRPPLPLPTVLPTELAEVPRRQKRSPTAPTPPVRTSSIPQWDGGTHSTHQPKGVLRSDDDKLDYMNTDDDQQDYVNIDSEGYPKPGLGYENVKFGNFEMIKGHMYDKPKVPDYVYIKSAEEMADPREGRSREDPERGRTRAKSEERMLESSFHVDLQEFENRRQARLQRHTARPTHEEVTIPPRDILRAAAAPSYVHESNLGGTREKATPQPRTRRVMRSRGGNRKQVEQDNTFISDY